MRHKAPIRRSATSKIKKQVRSLPDSEKLVLVDAILSELDKPDSAVDRVRAREAQRRWKAYKSGTLSVDAGTIVVVAVAHLHRKPSYWNKRSRRPWRA